MHATKVIIDSIHDATPKVIHIFIIGQVIIMTSQQIPAAISAW
jgi:hypothetical protein